MNGEFLRFLQAPPEARSQIFRATARRIPTSAANVEKDFWLVWTLDTLFNQRQADDVRLLFKGGTSLAKYDLIDRFSEDVDISVFRDDIGHPIHDDDLLGLPSRKQQNKALDAIKESCRHYITTTMRSELVAACAKMTAEAGLIPGSLRIEVDPDDPDGQTLLVHYPVITTDQDKYIRPQVKIESGAKSQVDPHDYLDVQPYVARIVTTLDLSAANVTTIDPRRTFHDKIVIAHGQHSFFLNRGELRGGGKRVSRHYYDLFKLINSPIYENAMEAQHLAEDCQLHASLFFNQKALDLDLAVPGSYRILPTAEMMPILAADYEEMSGMIIGNAPTFREIMETIEELDMRVNNPTPGLSFT